MDRNAFAAPERTSLIPTLSSSETLRTSCTEDRGAGLPYLIQEHSDSDDGSIAKMRGPSKRDKLRGLSRKTKAKTKKLLHIHGEASADGELDGDGRRVLANIEADPAFNPGKLVKEKPFTVRGAAEKTTGKLHSIASTVVHPEKNLRNKAMRTTADQLAKAERPFLSHNAIRELLEAHEELRRAQDPGFVGRGISEKERIMWEEDSRQKIEDIEKHRESLAVAYTTTRHVHRVRVVPKDHRHFPKKEAFIERDNNGDIVRYQYLRWLGNVLLYYTQDFSAQYIDDFDELPFDVDSIRHHVERLVVASKPWQAWVMDVRSVYRWESPRKTGKWFSIYLVLWYNEHLIGFVYGYVLYIVLKNRYFPRSVEQLRESVERSLDGEGTPFEFGELIDKHGRAHWLEPLIEDVGPFLQLQLSDMANMLEVFHNFHAWKSPQATANSLVLFASCLLITIVADTTFCTNVFWFIMGLGFFISWPISSHYPKYRYLVSPFKWIMWDIPTDAEWSFQYLRRQAQVSREQMIMRKVEQAYTAELVHPSLTVYTGHLSVPAVGSEDGTDREEQEDDDDWHSVSSSTSILEESDIIAFRAQCDGVLGRLIVYSSGIRFVRSLVKKEIWRYNFLELAEMRKLGGGAKSKLKLIPLEQLEFKLTDGRILHLQAVKNRDEAFNTIIGFSGLQWQALQAGPGRGGMGSKSGKESTWGVSLPGSK